MSKKDPIIFYQYFATTDLEYFKELLKKHNNDPFHVRHALTVEGVMRWFAKELGWELDQLLEKTIAAMQSCEASVEEACK